MKVIINYLINTFSIFTYITPNFILKIIWGISNPFCGYISVFIRNVLICKSLKGYSGYIYIGSNVTLKNMDNACLGENISIHNNSYIDAAGGLEIKNDVSIAHNTSIITFEHSWDDTSLPIKYNPTIYNSVLIGEDVWVGCGVRILSGTQIGKRVVVGAGSVVKGELLSDSIYVGNPLRRVKNI